MIVFTSGTTAKPQGCRLSYRNMCAASSTLGSFLELPGAAGAPTCLLVNPLHHVNSSVLADWALGVQGAALELVERYTTSYWRVLCEVAETFSAACGSSSCDCSGSPRCEKSSLGQGPDRNLISECTLEPAASSSGSSSASRTSACRCSCHSCSRSTSLSSSSPPGSSSPPPGSSSSRAACASRGILVCPLVPRHMEYLEAQLCAAGPSKLKLFGVSRRRLAQAVEPRRVILLVGSAPCGPQTVNRFERLLDGKLPTIRYGSTETCLQVLGTPPSMSALEWKSLASAQWQSEDPSKVGFWIGRQHAPHIQSKVVRSVLPDDENFMVECLEREPGYFVCQGPQLFAGYVAADRPHPFSPDGWYLGLGDWGFFSSHADGTRDFYYQSRSSGLLIKGGANYACQQISDLLTQKLLDFYHLNPPDVLVATLGMKLASEHEDSAVVTVDLLTPQAQKLGDEISKSFRAKCTADSSLAKSCHPDYVRLGTIPRTFKGAIDLPNLRKQIQEELMQGEGSAK
eukprot:GHVT01090883.1.p1 GENE.GHVT01090883.1~~GHVT01090883.1.p1  ORF type:complete len:514 (-),score=89.66 GHVT01090883.1:3854-5395(-)